MRESTLLLMCLCVTIPAQAGTLTVDDDGPADFNNIQAAIDDATHADTITVYDGVYTGDGNRDIDFNSKAIAVRSENGPGVTIVDCEGKGYGFYIVDNETSEARLEGFTIRNARHGAIKVYSSSPPRLAQAVSAGSSDVSLLYDPNYEKVTVENCIITESLDGGILCDGHNDVTVANCTIVANAAQGIYSYMSFPTIRNCIVAKNGRTGIRATGATISNCTIVENGLYGIWVREGQVTNCIVRANVFGQVDDCGVAAVVTYSDIQGGCDGQGNIDDDPLFVDPRAGNYHLQSGSPCIDAGDPNFVPQPDEADLDGRPRVRGGVVDMGAYEAGSILFVDGDAVGNNDGSSWADAYNYLQDALMMASAGDEIRVAQGIYRPDQFVLSKRPNLGREETFQLKSGVAVRGGYAGFGEREPNARDIGEYETILTGDLGSNDVIETDVYCLPTNKSCADNSFNVITASRTPSRPILDGFTITGGHDNGCDAPPCHGPSGYGGGMYNAGGNPIVMNCTFRANSAATYGGGMYNDKGSPVVRSCTFLANYARIAGGGMYCGQSNATIENCSFVHNVAPLQGGGLASRISDCLLVTRCLFIGNRADFAGAISNLGSHLHVANCTFAGNRGNGRDAIGIASFEGRASTVWANGCILWDSGREILINPDSMLDIAYCDVRGGQAAVEDPCKSLAWGEGNTSVDPCFANAGHWEDPCDTPYRWSDDIWLDGDYHLKSQAGRWAPQGQRWVQDDVTSPCIDAGDPASPIGNEPFPNGGIINMGAYGGTAEASRSYFGEPVCETIVAGDINGDCKVDAADFRILALHWLEQR